MRSRFVVLAAAAAAALSLAGVALAKDAGRSTETPGFYDCEQIRLLHKDFKDKPAGTLLDHNKNVNHIFEFPGMIDVVDAVPGDHFNGIWQEVQIEFTDSDPHQYCSDEDILDDFQDGLINLVYTDEVEICVVVGPKQ